MNPPSFFLYNGRSIKIIMNIYKSKICWKYVKDERKLFQAVYNPLLS